MAKTPSAKQRPPTAWQRLPVQVKENIDSHCDASAQDKGLVSARDFCFCHPDWDNLCSELSQQNITGTLNANLKQPLNVLCHDLFFCNPLP